MGRLPVSWDNAWGRWLSLALVTSRTFGGNKRDQWQILWSEPPYLSSVAAKMYFPFGENFTKDTGGLSSSVERNTVSLHLRKPRTARGCEMKWNDSWKCSRETATFSSVHRDTTHPRASINDDTLWCTSEPCRTERFSGSSPWPK